MTEPLEGLIIPHWETSISGDVQLVLVKGMTILLDFVISTKKAILLKIILLVYERVFRF